MFRALQPTRVATIGFVGLCLAGLIALQARIWSTDAEFLVRPVHFGPRVELVAVRMARRSLAPGQALRVTLLFRGSPPADLKVLIVPVAVYPGPQLAPDLRERSLAISWRSRVETVTPSRRDWTFPGTYGLRVPQSTETFGVFEIRAGRT